jgi:cation:H+ antiporter
MDLLPALALFALSLAVLLVGAKYFIDGLAVLAEAAGVPPLIIGMTVVAFGTSTPELVVNTLSAYKGETQLAFGNIVGSCIVNTGFVLAVTALVRPLKVEPSLITREIPMLLVAVSAFLVLAWDGVLVRADGLILLLLFGVFIYYTAIYSIANKLLAGPPHQDAFLEEVAGQSQSRKPSPRDYLSVAAGLAAVSFGADGAVNGATALARSIGLSDAVIGLTVVSLGTTLPELVTCVMAARKGNSDIALGNVVGSNLFNVMAIGGIVAAVAPIGVPGGGSVDLLVMAGLTIVLLPIAIRSGRTVTRGEGAFLLALYVAYLAYRLTQPAST